MKPVASSAASPQTPVPPTAAADSAPAKTIPASPWSRFRENAEAVIVAIVLALIIRHYSLEAFEIPTGSMAPGLHGVHVVVQCPNCDTEDPIGIETDSVSGAPRVDWASGLVYEGTCPECGARVKDRTQRVGPTYCSHCRQHRPSDPAGFREADHGFSWLHAWRLIPKLNYAFIGAAVLVALSVKRRSRMALAWAVVAALMAYSAYGVYARLLPKAAHIENTCSECGFTYRSVYEPSDCLGGHKILVNKFLYQVREPRRWEVIVFKFNRQRNYIKRLLGLPGERIRIIDGDLWTARGAEPLRIERKPEWAQDQLWFPVHDSNVVERGFVAAPAWNESSGWASRDDSTVRQFNGLTSSVAMTYSRPITSRVAYNSARGGSPGAPVFDLRIAADVTVGGGDGDLELQIVNGNRLYRCVLPVAGSPSDPNRPRGMLVTYHPKGQEVTELLAALPSDVALVQDREYALDFYRADGALVLRIDGTVVAEVAIPDTLRSNLAGETNTVRLVGHRVGGTLHRVRVFRDIFYTGNSPGRDPSNSLSKATDSEYAIPEDGYFAMGDNSASSLDSRNWGHLSRSNLLGRAFAIFWPGLPHRWEIGFIR
ncbi:MAG: S26 family signal peptidase [Planctomycetota bacterium]